MNRMFDRTCRLITSSSVDYVYVNFRPGWVQTPVISNIARDSTFVDYFSSRCSGSVYRHPRAITSFSDCVFYDTKIFLVCISALFGSFEVF